MWPAKCENNPLTLHPTHYPDVTAVLVIVSGVLRRALGALDLLRAQTHEPDLREVHDLLLLKLCQPVLEVLQCLCNRKREEVDWMNHFYFCLFIFLLIAPLPGA